LKKLPGYFMGKDAGLSMRPSLSPAFYRWGLAFVKNCTAGMETKNLHAMLTLAAKSQATTQALAREIDINIIDCGKLILTRTQEDLESYGKLEAVKTEYGLPVQMLGKGACLDLEPALTGWQGEFFGGLYARGDGVLDPALFCKALQKAASDNYGVRFEFGREILDLRTKAGRVKTVHTDQGDMDCDAAIICLGNEANTFLKPLNDHQNIYPLQGYSLTFPLGKTPPRTSITDPKNKMVFANLGDKIRIAGLADVNLPSSKIKARGQHLLSTAKRLWPDIADYSAPPPLWVASRPTTPSSLPIVRASKTKGLYYNIGHGSLGLTLAAGCAQKITELIAD